MILLDVYDDLTLPSTNTERNEESTVPNDAVQNKHDLIQFHGLPFMSVTEFVFSCLGDSSMITLHVSTLTFNTIQYERFNETEEFYRFFCSVHEEHVDDSWMMFLLSRDCVSSSIPR